MLKMRKNAIIETILMMLVLSLVSGCQAFRPNPDDNNLDSYSFVSNYKQDQNCEWGKKAAVYQSNIYFSDPASGGIFSMDLEGNSRQLVLESPDIRKLQLSSEGIYYLRFMRNVSNHNGEYRSFRLFFYDWTTHKTQNLQETSWYAQGSERDRELWDFYRTTHGNIANMAVGWAEIPFTNPILSLFYTSVGGTIPGEQFAFFRDSTSARVSGSEYPGSAEVAAYDQLYFSAESQFRNIDPALARYSLPTGAFSVTDQQKNQIVMNTDTVPQVFSGTAGHRTIDSFLQDGVLVHINNEVMLLSSDFRDSMRSALLAEEEIIRFVLVQGDTAYIIADQGVRDKSQSVYAINLVTFAYRQLYTCAKGEVFFGLETKQQERILWLDAEKLVTAQGDVIRIWALKGGEYQLVRTQKTSQTIVAERNKTDVAGNWLFVYQFSEANSRDELIEKLNIAIE